MGAFRDLTLVVVLGLLCFVAGRHSVKVPHVLVLDPNTGQFVPLVAPNNAQIMVASPDGIEPGVFAAHSKDSTKILILPPSLLPGADQSQSGPQNQAHKRPEMSHGERLDRASL